MLLPLPNSLTHKESETAKLRISFSFLFFFNIWSNSVNPNILPVRHPQKKKIEKAKQNHEKSDSASPSENIFYLNA